MTSATVSGGMNNSAVVEYLRQSGQANVRERLGVIRAGPRAEGEKIANDPEQVLWINRL